LPFRRVTPNADERYTTCIPLIGLEAAAGHWSEVQEAVSEPDAPDVEWVTWDSAPRFAKGMFVAHVRGRSMEPTIPDGAYCLFRRVPFPSSPDRPVLVRHAGASDPDTGGQYTVKLYREERGPDVRESVVLRPINPEFAPIVIEGPKPGEVRVLAELVEVLGQ